MIVHKWELQMIVHNWELQMIVQCKCNAVSQETCTLVLNRSSVICWVLADDSFWFVPHLWLRFFLSTSSWMVHFLFTLNPLTSQKSRHLATCSFHKYVRRILHFISESLEWMIICYFLTTILHILYRYCKEMLKIWLGVKGLTNLYHSL